MTKPQQPELRRSGKGATDQDSAKLHADEDVEAQHGRTRIPEDNRSGHRPEQEQDKPVPPA
ncbi:MAG: hypothetical protein GEU74_11675 [Nitriliruptorales bacterium]|nr:hypothetical protein [Nitriliruptorales bacterium]